MTELMMVVAILALVSAGVARFVTTSARDLGKTENRTDLTHLTQRSRDNLRLLMETSQMLLVNPADPDVDLGAYQTKIRTGILNSASGAPNPVNFLQMPTVTDTAKVEPSLAPYFGNQVMLAAAVGPLNLKVQTQASPLVRQDVSLDRYQFAAVYIGRSPHKVAGFPNAAMGAIQLVHWRSIPYVSYNQLARFTSPKKDEVCKALVALGYDLAWDVGVTSTAAAFHTIQTTAPFLVTLTAAAAPGFFPEHSWGLMTEYEKNLSYRPDPLKPVGRVQSADLGGGVSGFPSRYCLAYNNSAASPAPFRVNALFGDYTINLQVPQFAVPDQGGPGYPGGFEVLVLGQPGARELWARITLMASSGADQQMAAKAPKSYMAKAETAYVSFVDAF